MDNQAQIDARLREIDAQIAELQSQRKKLLDARSSLPKIVASGPPQSLQDTPEYSEKVLEKAFNMLEWTGFKRKEGEWAFLRGREGELVEDLRQISGFIDQLRKGKRLAVGRYEYAVSEDKFLNRYPRASV